jgi:hypothetical protein
MSRIGDQVFFFLPGHAWVLGTVTTIDASTGLLSCKSTDSIRGTAGEIASKLRDQMDVVPVLGSNVDDDVDDLLHLTILHDSTLLRCLYIRYMRDVIYTNIGAIVVALNPFSFSIPWYKDDQMPQYLSQGATLPTTILPHTWSTAHTTFFELVADMSPQFILVSGESGSGKTEASKIVVKYLSTISLERGSPEEAARCKECGHKLQQCSPILEAFGNAKTVRNDNSSRFGKFMRIQFSAKGVLSGAFIERYLLEKSRIITAGEGERLYHAFYLLLRGPMQKQLSLLQDAKYTSLSSGKTLKNADFDTLEDWNDVIGAMRTVGLDEAAITSVWKVSAGVITLLNVKIVSKATDGSCQIHPDSRDAAHKAAELWGVDPSILCNELVQTVMVIRGESSLRFHTEAAAVDCRDALCKALYDKLFEWLVAKCNALCDSGETAGWIGLLDIFGFEDFKVNSFEQLCINLANETLQGHYNTYVFFKDMEECAQEGINTASISCPDNSPCLQLISDSRTGIFAILDDQCSIGKGSDADFLALTISAHGKHKDFVVEKTSKTAFSVRHYAGVVKYETNGWVEKNRDNLKDGMRICLRKSTDPVIATLLDPPLDADAPKKRSFVSTFFRQQLAKLMKIINDSNPHWIRCIKPHPAKKPRMFHGELVLNQLESSGVLGTVKIRKAGYPVRIPFAKFVERFCFLANDGGAMRRNKEALMKGPSEACRTACGTILSAVSMNVMSISQTGKTKIFLKAEAVGKLEQLRRDFFDQCAVRIQQCGRGLRGRLQAGILMVMKAIAVVAAEYKAYLARSAEAREERARRIAVLKAQAEESSARLYEERYSLAASDFKNASLCCVGVLQTALDDLEAAWRREVVRQEEAGMLHMSTVVRFSFVMEAEEVGRCFIEADYWEKRHYLLLFCRDTLIDDLMDEEEYIRRSVMRSERNILHGEPDFFETARQLIFLELKHGADALFSQFCDAVNKTVIDPWYRTLLVDVEFGMSDDSPIAERPHRSRIACEESHQRELIKKFQGVVQRRIEILVLWNEEIRERKSIEKVEERSFSEVFQQAFAEHTKIFLSEGIEGLTIRESRVRREISSVEFAARRFLQESSLASRHIVEWSLLELDELKLRRSIWQNQHYSFLLLTDGTDVLTLPAMGIAMSVVKMEQELRNRLEFICLQRLERSAEHACAQLRMLRFELFLRRSMFLLHCLQHSELRSRLQVIREENAVRSTASLNARNFIQSRLLQLVELEKEQRAQEHRDSVVKSHQLRLGTASSATAAERLSVEREFRRMQDQFALRHGRLQHEANRSVWRSISPEN